MHVQDRGVLVFFTVIECNIIIVIIWFTAGNNMTLPYQNNSAIVSAVIISVARMKV